MWWAYILCPPPQVEGEGLGLCVKKFCVNNGYLYNIHRSLYQIAKNAGTAFSIYLVHQARDLCLLI